MICRNSKCGAQLPEGANFCPRCGKKVQPPERKTKSRGNGLGSVYKLPNGKWCAEKTLGWVADPLPPDAAPEIQASAGDEALPPIEEFTERDDLAARILELSGSAKWAAVHLGAEFTVATDAARLAIAMGGDLLSPGVSDEEAWAAALPLSRALIPSGCFMATILASSAWASSPASSSAFARMIC